MKIFSKEKSGNKVVVRVLGLKFKHKDKSSNKLYCVKDGVRKEVKSIKGVNVSIGGENNIIEIAEGNWFENCSIKVAGSNNFIRIGKSKHKIGNLEVIMHYGGNDKVLEIGEDFSCNGLHLQQNESGSEVKIGDDCMFSWNVILRNTDSHQILDAITGEALNAGPKRMVIGNHVWVATNCILLKNIEIGDNSIVAAGAVAAKKFDKSNVVIGGNPAEIIKEGITWSRDLMF